MEGLLFERLSFTGQLRGCYVGGLAVLPIARSECGACGAQGGRTKALPKGLDDPLRLVRVAASRKTNPRTQDGRQSAKKPQRYLTMKILLLHLGDIHFSAEHSNPVIDRVSGIVSAATSLCRGYVMDACVAVIAGDIADRGGQREYEIAAEFIQSIRVALESELNSPGGGDVPIFVIPCPGNHDCDLSGDQSIRDLVWEQVSSQPPDFREAYRAKLTEVQHRFFDFRQSVAPSTIRKSDLLCEYRIPIDGRIIQIVVLNTAWMSKRKEVVGTLLFPDDVLSSLKKDGDLTMTVFHHPLGWFEPNNARRIKSSVEKIADVILTGHEHVGERSEHRSETGHRHTLMAGGVLQESGDSNVSEFRAMVLHFTEDESPSVKSYKFEWKGERYERSIVRMGDGGAEEDSWEKLPLNTMRRGSDVRVAARHAEYVEDLGIAVAHPRIERVRLRDLYVFPDLREIDLAKEAVKAPVRVIRGTRGLEEVLSHQHVVLAGDTQSGKTSLGKVLFQELFDRGEVPVLIKDEPLHGILDPSRFVSRVDSLMASQYSTSVDVLQQLPKRRRAIIFDDAHRLARLSPKKKSDLLQVMRNTAFRVILLVHDVTSGLDELMNPDVGIAFSRYRILPFNHGNRRALLEKWLRLGQTESEDPRRLVRTLNEFRSKIDTIVGRNFVLPYPAYLLAILQAGEAATPIDTNASTHGYFYELLIRVALSRSSDQVSYDILSSYLTYLGHSIYMHGEIELDEKTWRGFHDVFNESRALSIPFESMRDKLLKLEILHGLGDLYRFKYRYFYYYFVAVHFRDHLSDTDIRDEISSMARSLYIERNANILLFLAHLTKDPFLVDELLTSAAGFFRDEKPAALEDDVFFLADVAGDFAEKKFLTDFFERDVHTEQKRAIEADDENCRADLVRETDRVAQCTVEPEEEEDFQGPLAEINAALKTVQILGQIGKNFPGAEASLKERIVRECADLSLRMLALILRNLSTDKDGLIEFLIELLRAGGDPVEREVLEHGARAILFGLASMASYGIIKRASSAIGSQHLELIYSRVFDHGSAAEQLIHSSIHLDHFGKFPMGEVKALAKAVRKRPFAKMLLRGLVIQHFQLFPTDRQTKQRVCKLLDIQYHSGGGGESRNMLVPPQERKKR